MGLKIKVLLTCLIFIGCGGLFLLSQTSLPEEKNTKVRPRWALEITSAPPKIFTYTTPVKEKENYGYVVYQITNPTDDNIRLGIDVCIRAIIDQDKPEKDIYYQNAIHPVIEDGIIIEEEKLTGINQSLQKDRIRELKKSLNYLNCKELMDKKEIKPRETIKCLAIFSEFNHRTVRFEVMFGGLVDVVKWRYDKEDETGGDSEKKIIYEYECKIWKVIYDSPGDEFYVKSRSLKEVKKEWLIRNYGPMGDKKGLESMMESLKDPNPLLRWTGWYLLYHLTGLDFEYDPQKSPEENKKPLENWREWWYLNHTKLVYNLLLNRFEIKEPPK